MPIHGYPGGVITANPVAPTSTVATGVWTTEQQLQAKSAGNWPFTIPTQQISRSLRFNSADSAYLNRTPASAGNRTTWTFSFWVKRSALSSNQFLVSVLQAGAADDNIGFLSDDTFRFRVYDGGATIYGLTTTQLFRDVSAWYHIVCVYNSTSATSSNRMQLYVNGTQVTAFGTATYPTQNLQSTGINNTYAHNLGRYGSGSSYFNGYITEFNFIDGQALTPSSFGQTNASTGVWEPIAYTGTYGNNGFYLNFSDNSGTTSTTLGKDYSGNGNNWTPNNFSVTAGAGNDSMVDSPTSYGTDTGIGGEVRGNYATLNPLMYRVSGGVNTITNGNLQVTGSSKFVYSTFQTPTTGKWYFEGVPTAGTSTAGIGLSGIETASDNFTNFVNYLNTGSKTINGTQTSYGTSWTTNDVIGVAVDCDAGTVTFYKNNVSQGAITTTVTNRFAYVLTGADWAWVMNFGQRAFAYTAPSGFKALCTQNLPTPTIGATSTTQANDYFNAVLYTGTGATRSITGVGFQPDFVWNKCRSAARGHALYDVIRGVTKGLASNTTGAEYTESGLTAFNSDGFSLGSASTDNNLNDTFVSWNWKANGAGVTNTAGTITSTVSANTTSGFSVVTFTGAGAATIGHGLGVAPSMVIMKARNEGTAPWAVYHASIGAGNYLALNSTAASTAATTIWNSTAPTSTVFSIGSGWSTFNFVAYCFAPVAGYSAFGSYTGNGSTDGPFVFTNFRPRYVLLKVSSTTSNWNILDSVRGAYNVNQRALFSDLSGAEENTVSYSVDFLSNGFKLRTSGGAININAATIIYAAFAENPFKYSLAR